MSSLIKKGIKYILNEDYRFLVGAFRGKYNNLADEEDELLNKIQEKFQFSAHLMGELIFVTKHLMLSMSLAQGIIYRY